MKEALIFLHIPKTGGTSLHAVLDKQYRRGRVVRVPGTESLAFVASLKDWPEAMRKEVVMVRGHLPFGLHQVWPQGGRYVTLLRDPVERVISDYYFVRRFEGHYLHKRVVAEGVDLEHYVCSGMNRETDNLQVRLLVRGGLGIAWDGLTEEHLAEAKANIEDWFVVAGVVERFDEALWLMRRRLGWGMPWYIRRNVTGGRPQQDEIEAGVLARIEARNKWDRLLYEWVRERFAAMVVAEGAGFERSFRWFQRLNGAYGWGWEQARRGWYWVRGKRL
ncbi:MAG TPA: hypothetical protein VLL52_08905 [Anaerolineae bacterium]|nr:hypothetical protein [Anaerolineae bacterium]